MYLRKKLVYLLNLLTFFCFLYKSDKVKTLFIKKYWLQLFQGFVTNNKILMKYKVQTNVFTFSDSC